MSGTVDIVSGLVRSFAIYGTAIAVQRVRLMVKTVALYLCAMCLFAVGLGFMTLSAYRALAAGLGDIYAALIVGGVYLVLGLLMLLIVEIRRSS